MAKLYKEKDEKEGEEDRHTTLYEQDDYVDLTIIALADENNKLTSNSAKKKQLKGDVCTFVVRSLCGAPVISVL